MEKAASTQRQAAAQNTNSMTTILTRTSERTIQPLPLPTAEPLSPREKLVALVLEAVQHVDWSQPTPDGRTGRMKTARAESILAVLTYCYAAGIYGTQDIEFEVSKRQTGRNLLRNYQLDASSFRLFRRFNRDLIKQCLVEVFCRLNGADDRKDWTSPRAGQNPPLAQARAAHLWEFEADQRLQRAMQWDSMAMDI
jgi:hypothetical protein